MIRLEEVKKIYANRCVLDIPSLRLEEGRRYAIVGPNGSGKTTLLRILAGALGVSCGTVEIPPALQTALGYMPQRPYAYGVSVCRNVMLALPKANKAGNRKQALAALQKVGMEALSEARGDRLSGGEAQRMAMARMLARPRGLLLLDEPTAAMDMAGNALVELALKRFCDETGCTLVFSTHSLGQASRLADTMLLLYDGRIAEQGPVEEVLYHAKSEEARAFIKYWRIEGSSTSALTPSEGI